MIPRHLREKLRSLGVPGTFWRAATVVAGGTALVQFISLLAAPLLTRLYDPAEFGAFALYLSLLSVLLGVCAFRYELAIPLPQDDADGAQLLVLSLLIVLGISLLLALVVAFYSERLSAWASMPALAPYLWLLPLALLGAGIYQVLSYWTMRRKAFAVLAKSRITQGIAKTSTQLALGAFGVGAFGLILGDLIGRLSSAIALAVMGRHGGPPIRAAVRLHDLLRVAIRFRSFAALSSGSALLNMATTHVPPLLLSLSFAAEAVGWFSLAQQVIFLPIALVAQAVLQVYIGDAPQAARQGPVPLRRLFLKISLGLALIGSAPAVLLAFVAPPLFSLAFGAPWTQAGVFAGLMAPLLFFTFVVSPLGYTLNVLERPDILLAWNAVRLAVVLCALLGVPALGGTSVMTIASYSAAVSVMYVALFVICPWQFQIRLRKIAAQPSQDPRNLSRGPAD